MTAAVPAWLYWLGQVLFAAFLVAIVALAGQPSPLNEALAAAAFVFALIHGARLYRWPGILLFLAITQAVSFATENLSIATGFPFGHYHFEVGAALPHIGAVPVIVGMLYFTMGYFSWVVASLLLDEADLDLRRGFNLVALPITAAFVLIQWDVVMDPPNATIHRAWIWHDGGGYFGVPLTNYAGWFLTVWIFYQAFGLVLSWRPRLIRPRPYGAWLPPILLYLAVGLSNVAPYLMSARGNVADAGGRVWAMRDLRESMAVVALATMVFTGVLALLRWTARYRRSLDPR